MAIAQPDFWAETFPAYLQGAAGLGALVVSIIALISSGAAKRTSEAMAKAESETRAVVADTIQEFIDPEAARNAARRDALLRWVQRADEGATMKPWGTRSGI